MKAPDVTLKQYDNGIAIKAELKNKNGPVDLTGANVLFSFDNHQVVSTIEDPTAGKVLVAFESLHTSKTGTFQGDFKVMFPDSRKETFPNDGYIKLKIMSSKGGN